MSFVLSRWLRTSLNERTNERTNTCCCVLSLFFILRHPRDFKPTKIPKGETLYFLLRGGTRPYCRTAWRRTQKLRVCFSTFSPPSRSTPEKKQKLDATTRTYSYRVREKMLDATTVLVRTRSCRVVYAYKKPKIQAPGTTFSNFSDEVRPDGRHGELSLWHTRTRECTTELISALPKFGSKETVGAITSDHSK